MEGLLSDLDPKIDQKDRSLRSFEFFDHDWWSIILVMNEISIFYELSLVSRLVMSKKDRYYR